MKEKYLTNARIIDPKNDLDEVGGLIIDSKGLIKASGKKVANGNLPSSADKIDLSEAMGAIPQTFNRGKTLPIISGDTRACRERKGCYNIPIHRTI